MTFFFSPSPPLGVNCLSLRRPLCPAEGLCVQGEDGLPGLFEKQMSSLMNLVKLLYCLCLLLLYYEDTENSWCARKVSYPSLMSMCTARRGKALFLPQIIL